MTVMKLGKKTQLNLKVRKLVYCKFIWTIVDVLCIRHQIRYA